MSESYKELFPELLFIVKDEIGEFNFLTAVNDLIKSQSNCFASKIHLPECKRTKRNLLIIITLIASLCFTVYAILRIFRHYCVKKDSNHSIELNEIDLNSPTHYSERFIILNEHNMKNKINQMKK